jgi:hypothetical protein
VTGVVKAYVEEIAEGRVPAEDSLEAKEFRAWSWAQARLKEIVTFVDAMDDEMRRGTSRRSRLGSTV